MHYHITGIAGAGMSAIAHILLDQGHTVSGSDVQRNALTEALEQRGALIREGHDPAWVTGADALVATSAVRDDHIELSAARARGIPSHGQRVGCAAQRAYRSARTTRRADP